MALSARPDAPLGARIEPAGVSFRVWAPGADAVHVAVLTPGAPSLAAWSPDPGNLLVRDDRSFWSGFVPGAAENWEYRFWTRGPGGQGFKRDPRARELALEAYPDCNCIVRAPDSYPWHDAAFRPPAFNDLIIYQLHIGVFYAQRGNVDIRANRVSKFLDVVDRIEYLAALGVNAIQPLPVVEWQGIASRGYNNTDFFSPEMDCCVAPDELAGYLPRLNALLRKKGFADLDPADVQDQVGQLKALIDLCHINGIAVIADVVYNHGGGPFDEQSMRFFDRPANHEWWDRDSYFVAGDGWAGGRIFDYSADDVRQFLIDNARMYLDEFHIDGLRYDEVTVIHHSGGDRFCRDITSTLRYQKPAAIQIAEYWDWDSATPVVDGGLGFDATWDDKLRDAIRGAVAAAAVGASAPVDLNPIRDALGRRAGFPAAWKSVIHLENHDLVDADRDDPREIRPRVPALACWTDRRNWYARSRSRVAAGLLMTAPGIPMLFMGQEFLEDKPWHNSPGHPEYFIYWAGLDADPAMRDFLRFVRELCWLRRRHPALRGEACNPYYVHNDDRVLAFHRWLEGQGRDVIVVASFNESTYWNYGLPLPTGGIWHEVFNSDAYDSLPGDGRYNPNAAGNLFGLSADGPPLHGSPVSAGIVIPANGLLVFARDRGDQTGAFA
jgi:1,4-alpha-glucan branching enzyme